MPEDKKPSSVMSINGKEVDFKKAWPFTIGDMKKLKKEYGVNLSKIGADGGIDIEDMHSLILYSAKKSNPEITAEDVDEIPSTRLGKIMEVFQVAQKELDPPF